MYWDEPCCQHVLRTRLLLGEKYLIISLCERKSTIVRFVNIITRAQFFVEPVGFDLNDPDDDFDYDYYVISVSNTGKDTFAYISIRIDFSECKYWVCAGDGYYIIGQKRSLECDYESLLTGLLKGLLDA
ncbi:MAG: hypothetical protein C9356_11930 [Oleiphilus sp.]|nr:MAG: hypothetical protein C9356_11930 [Oleiphilus sp.]